MRLDDQGVFQKGKIICAMNKVSDNLLICKEAEIRQQIIEEGVSITVRPPSLKVFQVRKMTNASGVSGILLVCAICIIIKKCTGIMVQLVKLKHSASNQKNKKSGIFFNEISKKNYQSYQKSCLYISSKLPFHH